MIKTFRLAGIISLLVGLIGIIFYIQKVTSSGQIAVLADAIKQAEVEYTGAQPAFDFKVKAYKIEFQPVLLAPEMGEVKIVLKYTGSDLIKKGLSNKNRKIRQEGITLVLKNSTTSETVDSFKKSSLDAFTSSKNFFQSSENFYPIGKYTAQQATEYIPTVAIHTQSIEGRTLTLLVIKDYEEINPKILVLLITLIAIGVIVCLVTRSTRLIS